MVKFRFLVCLFVVAALICNELRAEPIESKSLAELVAATQGTLLDHERRIASLEKRLEFLERPTQVSTVPTSAVVASTAATVGTNPAPLPFVVRSGNGLLPESGIPAEAPGFICGPKGCYQVEQPQRQQSRQQYRTFRPFRRW